MKRNIKFRVWSHINIKMYFDLAVIKSELRHPSTHNELMQFTGLHDKNGVEIYEGDLVNIDNEENPVLTKCVWDIGGFTLEDKASGHWTRQLYHHPERLLIIGNIHQNPELL